MIEDREWITAREAADLIGVHQKSIRRWIRLGILPAFRAGPNTVRIRRSDLLAMERTVTRKVSR